MKQVWITKVGPPEVLKLREAQDPVATAGTVRVRVRASGINFADIMARLRISVIAATQIGVWRPVVAA